MCVQLTNNSLAFFVIGIYEYSLGFNQPRNNVIGQLIPRDVINSCFVAGATSRADKMNANSEQSYSKLIQLTTAIVCWRHIMARYGLMIFPSMVFTMMTLDQQMSKIYSEWECFARTVMRACDSLTES